jgi:hypothetical protein
MHYDCQQLFFIVLRLWLSFYPEPSLVTFLNDQFHSQKLVIAAKADIIV